METANMDRNALYGTATAATVIGWASGQVMAFWLVLPGWAQNLTQFVVTMIVGLTTLTVSHFYRRFLRRRWPDRDRRKGDTAE